MAQITASSLVQVDEHCRKVIDSPHPERPDVLCVLHTHTPAGIAVSAQAGGVLPISQQSTFVLASLARHDYEGVAFRPEESPRLQTDPGGKNFLQLKNQGLLTVGRSIAEASLSMHTFEATCRIQAMAQSGGSASTWVGPAIIEGRSQAMRVQTGGLGGAFAWPRCCAAWIESAAATATDR